MAYTMEDKRRWLILQCRYYKGEPLAPKNLPEGYLSFWNHERYWVEWMLQDDEMIKRLEKEVVTFHLESRDDDKTPLTLKALLWNHFSNCSWNPLEVELENFEQWYRRFYQMWKTNREHRADKRKPALISRCRYYHGEETCPYANQFNILMWQWEREWVDALADSYSNRERFLKEFMETPGFDVTLLTYWQSLAHKVNIPATLLAYLGINYAKGYGGFLHEMEENFKYFISDYLSIKPSSRSVLK